MHWVETQEICSTFFFVVYIGEEITVSQNEFLSDSTKKTLKTIFIY